MASTSSSLASTILNIPVSEKLNRGRSLPPQSASRRRMNLKKKLKIQHISPGLLKISNFLPISSPPWPRKSWFKFLLMNMLRSCGRPLTRCSRLSRIPRFCSFVLSYLGRKREMRLLLFTIARWRPSLIGGSCWQEVRRWWSHWIHPERIRFRI